MRKTRRAKFIENFHRSWVLEVALYFSAPRLYYRETQEEWNVSRREATDLGMGEEARAARGASASLKGLYWGWKRKPVMQEASA